MSEDGEKNYSVKQLSRTYISRLISPDPRLVESITKNYFALDSEFTTERSHVRFNRYSMKAFKAESRSRMVIANKLKEAASYSLKGDFDLAEQILIEAKTLDPAYFEAHRVESFIAQQQHDWTRALSSMETAISLAPEEPQLHFYTGGLLLRLSENDKAAEYLERAHELDPNESIILREIARNEMIRGEFDRAQRFINLSKNAPRRSDRDEVILLDLELQLYVRKAEFLTKHRDSEGALACIGALAELLPTIQKTDSRMTDHVARVGIPLRALERQYGEVELLRRCRLLLAQKFPDAGIESVATKPGAFYGAMRVSGRTETFGFIQGSRGCDTFVHRRSASPRVWEHMLAGGEVNFDIEPFEGRERACNISIVMTAGDEGHSQG